ncbi:LysR family transcriptional regulator [bacterium]|nr:LysR family transcriptional regulator [bacterium]
MEMQQLRGFYYSARLKSLTKAAEKLSVTQSAVTQQIKNLERNLDVQLFNRYGPRKELTPEGQLLFDLVAPVVQEFEGIQSTFDDLKGQEHGAMTIAATTLMIMNFLPFVVKRFARQYPHVRLIIRERRWDEIIELAQLGEIDMGISPIVKMPQNLQYFPLEPIGRMLITGLGHPLAQKSLVTLADIAQYPMIAYETGTVARGEVDRVFQRAQLSLEVVLEATNAETIKRYVEMGIGIAIIPKIALTPEQTPRLVAIPVHDQFEETHYGVILRKGKHLTAWAKNFLLLLNPALHDRLHQ